MKNSCESEHFCVYAGEAGCSYVCYLWGRCNLGPGYGGQRGDGGVYEGSAGAFQRSGDFCKMKAISLLLSTGADGYQCLKQCLFKI